LEKLKIFSVEESLIDFYRTFDSRILLTKDNRKYLGIVLVIDSIEYLAPLSSPKIEDYDDDGLLKADTLTIIRLEDFSNIEDRKKFYDSLESLPKKDRIDKHIKNISLGKVFLANMIPVKTGTYSQIDIITEVENESEEEKKYRTLLLKQYILINRAQIKKKITTNSKIVFTHKKKNLDKGYVKACYNFIELSEKLKNYKV
jgi:hypothetical protein